MSADTELERLRLINKVLIERVERSLDQKGNAFSLFQTAINLEAQVKQRTAELSRTLADLERSHAELEQARDAAETANRSKTRFLAAASHDVLQPLNAAMLTIPSLSNVQGGDEGRHLCRQVERSLETMAALLRTLLYISRLDTGDIVPERSNVDLDRLFDSLRSDFEPLARVRGLSLRVRRTDLHVLTDETLLRRVLQNILANALRYTDSGGVVLGASACGDRVHVRIADTGIGIARERQQDVFAEFSRGSQPDTTGPAHDAGAGLGLGLAIVDRLVKALDHTLGLRSRVGRGSCFHLTLPHAEPVAMVQAPGTRPLTSPTQGLRGARLLVIENDPDALVAMEALLGQWGCDVRTARSTDAALAEVRDGDWRSDLLVADQHLDGDDRGVRAIAAVRDALDERLPALLVTAAPSPALYQRTERDGIELMEKPLKPAPLRALLSHLASARRSSDESPQRS